MSLRPVPVATGHALPAPANPCRDHREPRGLGTNLEDGRVVQVLRQILLEQASLRGRNRARGLTYL